MKRSALAALAAGIILLSFLFSACGEVSVKLTYAGDRASGATAVSSGNASDTAADGNNEADSEYNRYVDICNTGYSYLVGIGVEKDYAKAFECFQEAADYGIPEAITNLGYCYERGINVDIDYSRAVELYEKASELGDSSGMNNLGWCYEQGLGVEQSYERAYEYYYRASMKNNASAYENRLYLERNGFVK